MSKQIQLIEEVVAVFREGDITMNLHAIRVTTWRDDDTVDGGCRQPHSPPSRPTATLTNRIAALALLPSRN